MLKLHKKGVSVMIGYVLLVSLAVFMGGILYVWMKSYIPNNPLECPEGTSIIIKSYQCTPGSLNLTLGNNGRFDIAGYHIKATNSINQTIATIDLVPYLLNIGNVFKYAVHQAVLMGTGNSNSFTPGEEITNSFDILSVGQIYLLEITPVRWQDENNRLRFVSCGNLGNKQEVTC